MAWDESKFEPAAVNGCLWLFGTAAAAAAAVVVETS
jgi:hypothetical protein